MFRSIGLLGLLGLVFLLSGCPEPKPDPNDAPIHPSFLDDANKKLEAKCGNDTNTFISIFNEIDNSPVDKVVTYAEMKFFLSKHLGGLSSLFIGSSAATAMRYLDLDSRGASSFNGVTAAEFAIFLSRAIGSQYSLPISQSQVEQFFDQHGGVCIDKQRLAEIVGAYFDQISSKIPNQNWVKGPAVSVFTDLIWTIRTGDCISKTDLWMAICDLNAFVK